MLSAKHERFNVRGANGQLHEEHQLVFAPLVRFDTRPSKGAELPARWQKQLRLAHLMVPASVSRVDPAASPDFEIDDEPERAPKPKSSPQFSSAPGAGSGPGAQKEIGREPLLSGASDDESDSGVRPPPRHQMHPTLPHLLPQLRFACASRLLSAPQPSDMLATLVLYPDDAVAASASGAGCGGAQEAAFDMSSVFFQYRHYLVVADSSAQTLFAVPIRRHFIEVQSSRRQYGGSTSGELPRALRFGRETLSMYLPPAEPSAEPESEEEPNGCSKLEGVSIAVVYTSQSYVTQKLPEGNHKAAAQDDENGWQKCVEFEEGVLLRLAIESFPVVRLENHTSSALLIGQSTETLALMRGGGGSYSSGARTRTRVFEQRDRLGQPASVRGRSAIGYTPPLINFYLSVQLERDNQLWQRAASGPAAALELFRRSAESHTKLLALSAQRLVLACASATASVATGAGAIRWSRAIQLPDLAIDEEPEVIYGFDIGEKAFTLRVDASATSFPITIHVIDPLDPEPPLRPAATDTVSDNKRRTLKTIRKSWKRRVTSNFEFGQLQLLLNDSQLAVPEAIYIPTFGFTVNHIRASSDYCPAAEVQAMNADVCGCEFTRLRSELSVGAVEVSNLCHALQHADGPHRFAGALPGLPPFLYGTLVSSSRLIAGARVDATLAHLPQSIARIDRRASIDPGAEFESMQRKHPARRSRSVLLREVAIEFGDRLELLIEDTFLLHLSNLIKSYGQAILNFVPPPQYATGNPTASANPNGHANSEAASEEDKSETREPESPRPGVEAASPTGPETPNGSRGGGARRSKKARDAESDDSAADMSAEEELLVIGDGTAVGLLRTLLNALVVGRLRIGPMSTQLTLQCKSRVMPMCVSLSDAQLQFPAFTLGSSVLVPQLLARELISHYMVNALFTSARVLGSLEMLGNPAGIAREWSSGVGALFGVSDRRDAKSSAQTQRSSHGFFGSLLSSAYVHTHTQ